MVVIILVWVKLSQDPVECPEDLSACLPPAGERQGSPVGTQPCSGGRHLEDGEGPSGTNSAMGILLFAFPCSHFWNHNPEAQVVTAFLLFQPCMGEFWDAAPQPP